MKNISIKVILPQIVFILQLFPQLRSPLKHCVSLSGKWRTTNVI